MTGNQILVRYGWLGTIGKFTLPDVETEDLDSLVGKCIRRGHRVVIESPRGLEIGTSLGGCRPEDPPMGQVLREALPEDEFLERQLYRLSRLARQRCLDWLSRERSEVALLEVEPLLDGRTLYYHFLSGVDDSIEQRVEQFTRMYEAEVLSSEFVQRLIIGCGPGCGTDRAGCRDTHSRGCGACTACGMIASQGRKPHK